MATMRPLQALTLFSASPLVFANTCRVSPPLPSFDGPHQQQRASLSQQVCPAAVYNFRIAAAFAGKHQPFDARRDVHRFPPRSNAHRRGANGKPLYNSGQDAFFVAAVGNGTTATAFGVADGVGGWEESGVDPALFSHGLCGYMENRAAQVRPGKDESWGPLRALQAGYDDVVKDPAIRAGGSTAVVAVGRNDGSLEVAK